MLIWIGPREKYGNKVFLLIFSPIILLLFRLVITYFRAPQFAPDHTIFVKFFPGGGGGGGGGGGMPPETP